MSTDAPPTPAITLALALAATLSACSGSGGDAAPADDGTAPPATGAPATSAPADTSLPLDDGVLVQGVAADEVPSRPAGPVGGIVEPVFPGVDDAIVDTDGDGFPDRFGTAGTLDPDGGGAAAALDDEEIARYFVDLDGDGRFDAFADLDGNGVADVLESGDLSGLVDVDGDGQPDGLADSDGDGVPDLLDASTIDPDADTGAEGVPGPGEAIDPEAFAPLVGLWDATSDDGRVRDVVYLEFTAAGELFIHDYLGDSFSAVLGVAANCYLSVGGPLASLGGDTYRLSGQDGAFEFDASRTREQLAFGLTDPDTGARQTFVLPPLEGLSSIDFTSCR